MFPSTAGGAGGFFQLCVGNGEVGGGCDGEVWRTQGHHIGHRWAGVEIHYHTAMTILAIRVIFGHYGHFGYGNFNT